MGKSPRRTDFRRDDRGRHCRHRRQAAHDAIRLKRIQERKERSETSRLKNPDRGYRGEYAIGSTWYTDGTTTVRVKNGELPPTGFVKGRSSIFR